MYKKLVGTLLPDFPTMAPSFTDHQSRFPRQPSRVFPLKSVLVTLAPARGGVKGTASSSAAVKGVVGGRGGAGAAACWLQSRAAVAVKHETAFKILMVLV